jgi:Leucine-rich repeat (LRR) protein
MKIDRGCIKKHANKTFVLKLSDKKISWIDEDAFHDWKLFVSVDLSNNQLGVIAEDTFSCLLFLRNLDLAKNTIFTLPKNIFASNDSLAELDLSSNHLDSIEFLAGLKNLKTLDLSSNRIGTLRDGSVISGLNSLEYLYLSKNCIDSSYCTDMFSGKPEKLVALSLASNTIKMNVNLLMNMVERSTDLKSIDLSNNELDGSLVKQSFERLVKLEEINFSNNRIVGLTRSLFSCLPNLKRKKIKICYLEVDLLKNVSPKKTENEGKHFGRSSLQASVLNDNLQVL